MSYEQGPRGTLSPVPSHLGERLLSSLALCVKSRFCLLALIRPAPSLPTASQQSSRIRLPLALPQPPASLSPAGTAPPWPAGRAPSLRALPAPIRLAHCGQINLLKRWFLNPGAQENRLGSLLGIQMP